MTATKRPGEARPHRMYVHPGGRLCWPYWFNAGNARTPDWLAAWGYRLDTDPPGDRRWCGWAHPNDANMLSADEFCEHCHDDPPRGHTCPVCGRSRPMEWP